MVGTGYSRLILPIVCFLSILTLRAQFDPRAEIKRTGTESFRGVEEKDGYVYVVGGSRTLFVFDLRDLTAEGAFASYDEPIGRIEEAGGSNLLRNGNYLYAAGYGLHVYDISTPATPVHQRTISSPRIDNLALAGNRLYLVGHDYLAAYSIDDPSTPVLRDQIALDGGSGYSVAVSGTIVYVSEWLSASQTGRLRAVDAADIDNLVDRGAIDQEDVAYHLEVQDEGLIAFESGRIRVYSLADPTRPVEMDNLPAAARAAKSSCGFLVTNGRIFRVTEGRLEQILQFDPGGHQLDGAPHGAVARDDFVFLVQTERVLILSTPPALTFPQYVTGQSEGVANRTRIILRNAGPLPQSGTIVFRNASGVAQTVTLGGRSTARYGFDLPPWGTLDIETNGQGGLLSGPLEVRAGLEAQDQLEGAEVFEVLGHFVSVPSASWESESQIYVSVDGGENTGVAIANPDGDQAVQIDLALFDQEGNDRGKSSIELAAHEQRALFVTDASLFGSILSGVDSFKGTMNITTRGGRVVSVTALIQKKADGRLLALPSGKKSIAELLSSQPASAARSSESGL